VPRLTHLGQHSRSQVRSPASSAGPWQGQTFVIQRAHGSLRGCSGRPSAGPLDAGLPRKAHCARADPATRLPGYPATRTNHWTAAYRAFHHTLIEAADNHVLLGICQRLCDAAQLYSACSGRDGSGRDVRAERKALLDAALAHQAERAVALFEAHIE